MGPLRIGRPLQVLPGTSHLSQWDISVTSFGFICAATKRHPWDVFTSSHCDIPEMSPRVMSRTCPKGISLGHLWDVLGLQEMDVIGPRHFDIPTPCLWDIALVPRGYLWDIFCLYLCCVGTRRWLVVAKLHLLHCVRCSTLRWQAVIQSGCAFRATML